MSETDAREAERMRLFCEIYAEAFRKSGNRYTEGTYARTALEEFDKSFPKPTPPNTTT